MNIFQLSLKRTFVTVAVLFVIVAVITLTVGGMSYQLSRQTKDQTVQLTRRNLPALQLLAKVEEATLKYHATNTEFVLAKDEASMAAKAKTGREWSDKVERNLADLATLVDSEETRRLRASFREALTVYQAAVVRLQTALKAGDFDKAMATLDVDLAKARQNLDGTLAAISEHYFNLSSSASDAATHAVDRNLQLTLTCTAISAAVIVFATIFVQVIASRTSRRFAENLGTLGVGSQQVQSGATSLTAGSQSLAKGASEQAASLEETGASLTEMSSMTRRNAESAQAAKVTAATARETANQGATQMTALESAMSAIHGASNEITKILKTIDEIAFQTNILALNAAVEAARAGDAGMGFAVVAEEVRNLAQRSAQAAKETALKIEDSVNKSQQGVRISAEAQQSFVAIQRQVRELDSLVSEIAASSKEQSEGIDQINKAVQEMDKVTQSTAANAEETAASAEELNAQSVTLHAAIGQLRELVGVASAAASASNLSSSSDATAVVRHESLELAGRASRPQRSRNGRNAHDLNFA